MKTWQVTRCRPASSSLLERLLVEGWKPIGYLPGDSRVDAVPYFILRRRTPLGEQPGFYMAKEAVP